MKRLSPFHPFLGLFLLLLIIVSCGRPQGFTLKKILSSHPNDPRWDVSPLSPIEAKKLDQILSQPFTYLGSGNHCYAFSSSEGSYVLKFFKQKHMKTQSLTDYLPFLKRPFFSPTQHHLKRKKEREKSFNSYKIAYEFLKKETGIFYLHLNKTSHLKRHVTLIDQHQIPITIDIDQMEFLIQQKAKVGYQRLEELLSSKKKEEALECIASLFNVIIRRIEKGFFDRDIQFFKNFGFINNQAIEIDIGEFQIDSIERNNQEVRTEIQQISFQLTDWIEMHYPLYKEEVQTLIQDIINQIRD